MVPELVEGGEKYVYPFRPSSRCEEGRKKKTDLNTLRQAQGTDLRLVPFDRLRDQKEKPSLYTLRQAQGPEMIQIRKFWSSFNTL